MWAMAIARKWLNGSVDAATGWLWTAKTKWPTRAAGKRWPVQTYQKTQ